MKKLVMTIAIVFGLCMTTFADPNGGGLFQRGSNDGLYNREGGTPGMPIIPGHGSSSNEDGGETTPVGTGIALLTALGAAYLVGKKRNEK